MNTRIVQAYGGFRALVGSGLLIIAGLLLIRHTVVLTRRPLPLVWPLGVVQIAVAQIPLCEILGPAERLADRSWLVRAGQALFCTAMLLAGYVTYVNPHREPIFMTFFLLLAAVGFLAAICTGGMTWAWTLGIGMLVVGLQFITPLTPASKLLAPIPKWVAGLLLVASACAYIPARGHVMRPPGGHRRAGRGATLSSG